MSFLTDLVVNIVEHYCQEEILRLNTWTGELVNSLKEKFSISADLKSAPIPM